MRLVIVPAPHAHPLGGVPVYPLVPRALLHARKVGVLRQRLQTLGFSLSRTLNGLRDSRR